MGGLPDEASKDILRTCNLNTYLVENLVFRQYYDKKIRYELLQRISASSGIVQAGERIIDRGEIVSPHTYLILKSLETVTLKKKINMDRRETTFIGQAIVITCIFTFFYLFLALFRSRIFKDIRSLGFLMIMITGVTLAAYLMTQTRLQGIYLVPFAILPLIVVTFLDSRTALYALWLRYCYVLLSHLFP